MLAVRLAGDFLKIGVVQACSGELPELKPRLQLESVSIPAH